MISHKTLIGFTAMVMLLLPCGCTGGADRGDTTGGDTVQLRYAEEIELVKHDGFTVATVRNPWDTTAVLARYILAPDSTPAGRLPQGTVIRVPLKKSLVYSSVHIGLIDELGADTAIAGVCDARFINLSKIKNRLSDHSIADCGNSMNPDIEKIIHLSPDAILLSPYENSSVNARLEALGIPIVQCADYMESTPLARAEWMKFFGILYGGESTADSLFAETEKEYLSLKSRVADTEFHPVVIFDTPYGSQWFMPGESSTTATYIRDAGGKNPFDSYKISGSVPLSAEQVLMQAKNADYWLVRYASSEPLSLKSHLASNKIYSQFDAAVNKNIFACNTIENPLFDETPFHPQWFLAELISIIHPELGIGSQRQYFKRL
ncbi:MAG: ABC transporter substrate-binding protein [Paramuribaculum sp.]|nr:ABC transporter substrate-binding protein [Paramuribaculum sp.]